MRKPIGKVAVEAAECFALPESRCTARRRFGVLFLLFMTLIILFRVSDADAAREPEAMGFTYKAHHYAQLGADFRFIYATGPFVQGTAADFRLFVQQNKVEAGAVVILESDGGSVAEALSMGRLIRQMGFDTEVTTHCFSSCTLAFIGGVRRYVADVGAEFGVHRGSTNARLDPAQALDLGQIAIAEIVEYSAFMGVDPRFVTALTAAGPDQINFLSQDQLLNYKIVSRAFTTEWEIKAGEGHFYLVGTTDTNNGHHKMIFLCNPKKEMEIMMLYNASDEHKEDVLKWTKIYRLDIDGKEYTLSKNEIVEPVQVSGDNYVSVVIHLIDPLKRSLSGARVVGFKMLPPSTGIYAGWYSDFASGRDKYIEFERTCHLTTNPTHAKTTHTTGTFGNWTTTEGTNSNGNPMCTAALANAERMFFLKHEVLLSKDVVIPMIQILKQGWQVAEKQPGQVVIQVDNGIKYTYQGWGLGNVPGYPTLSGFSVPLETTDSGQLTDFNMSLIAAMRTGRDLKISFPSGSEPTWSMPLNGVKAAFNEMMNCLGRIAALQSQQLQQPRTQPFVRQP